MSQKYIRSKNNNSHNAKTYNKYYAKPVYDEKFIETDEIADFIQTQATLKRSDIERIVVGSSEKNGKIIQKYVNAKTLLKDVSFEEAHGITAATGTSNAPANNGGSNTNPSNPTNGDNGGNTGGNGGNEPGGDGNDQN